MIMARIVIKVINTFAVRIKAAKPVLFLRLIYEQPFGSCEGYLFSAYISPVDVKLQSNLAIFLFKKL